MLRLTGDGSAAVREFADVAFPAAEATSPHGRASVRADEPVPYEDYVPVFFMHDGSSARMASPREILVHAQYLIARRFHRKGLLLNQLHVVRALLHAQLAAHPRTVFAALFLSRDMRLLDFAEIFTGTVNHVGIHPREVLREALHRNAEAIILARNDPTGDGAAWPLDAADALRVRRALTAADIKMIDYLIVGREITSLAEMGVL
jgi:DNA repair protein RadC